MNAAVWAERRRAAGMAHARPLDNVLVVPQPMPLGSPTPAPRLPPAEQIATSSPVRERPSPRKAPAQKAAEPPPRRKLTYKDIAGEQGDLIRRYQSGDQAAGGKLVEAHGAFIWTCVKRYRGMGFDDEDLMQWGRVGFLRGVEKFDPARGALLTCVTIWIRATVGRALADTGSVIRIPAGLRDEARTLRDLTDDEVPDRIFDARAALRVSSLDIPCGEHSNSTVGMLLATLTPSPEDSLVDAEEQTARVERIGSAMLGLTDRERDIIRRRYLQDESETLDVVGTSYGISRERVRQLEGHALAKIRRALVAKNA